MPKDKPNIVFIITDQHRYDSIGCAGHPVLKTPHIDRLAQEGVRFDRAYVVNPICGPSRASILTGRYPHEHGVVTNLIDMDSHQPTFIQLLSSAGYYTAGFGSITLSPPDESLGFQYIDALQSAASGDSYHRYIEKKGLSELVGQPKGEELPFGVYTNSLEAEDYVDSYTGRRAAQFIDQNKERPFMVWVGFQGPHPPFDPPEPYDKMYDPKDVPIPPKVAGDLEGKPAMEYWHRFMGCEKLSDELVREIRAHYYGKISLIDDSIGRIIESLERNNLRENTLIVLTADHGELLGEHQLMYKCEQSMYEPSVRVPFILSGPAPFRGGEVRSEFVQSVDLAPTFLELCGLEIPYQMQGRSILSLLEGRSDNWPDAAFCEGRAFETREGLPEDELDLPVVMIRTDRWKYIFHRQEEAFSELYDLQNDPNEHHNLIGRSEYASLIAELRERILLWRFDTQRALHGEIFSTFKEQMDRPLTTGRPGTGVIWAEP